MCLLCIHIWLKWYTLCKSCAKELLNPMGWVLIFSGMRQSLSALLNICNETSLGSFSICLSLACLLKHNAGRWQRWLEHLQSSWRLWINILLLVYPAVSNVSSQVMSILFIQPNNTQQITKLFSGSFTIEVMLDRYKFTGWMALTASAKETHFCFM